MVKNKTLQQYNRYGLHEKELISKMAKEILKSVQWLTEYSKIESLQDHTYPVIKAYLYHQRELGIATLNRRVS